MKELQINEQIRDKEIRLIGDDGQQYGVISMREARAIAEEKGLDVCKVSPPSVQPPTCKLMDYGKYRYEQQKREKEAKKNQRDPSFRNYRHRRHYETCRTNGKIPLGRQQSQSVDSPQRSSTSAPRDCGQDC